MNGNELLARRYAVTVFPDPDGEGGYVADAPDFPGLCAGGETPEEALRCAYDGIAVIVEDMIADGEDLPVPSVAAIAA